MYLNWELWKNAENIDSKQASVLYAVDRFLTYQKELKDFYNKEDSILLLDRYTTANALYQAWKLDNEEQIDNFLSWLYDFEFNILGLPKPDKVLFLDMSPKYAAILRKNRKNKITGNDKQDIHEKNQKYLEKVYKNSKYVAQRDNWEIIKCVKNQKILPIKDIQKDLYQRVREII